jgi:hypothetical protein
MMMMTWFDATALVARDGIELSALGFLQGRGDDLA